MAYLTHRPAAGNINTPFGPRPKPTPTSPAIHYGQDYGWGGGDTIYAARSGVVLDFVYAGAYGNRMRIQHSDGKETWYCHLASSLLSGPAQGQRVAGGQRIALMGATGNVTAKHLHFELRNANGVAIDPEPYFTSGTAPADLDFKEIDLMSAADVWNYQVESLTTGKPNEMKDFLKAAAYKSDQAAGLANDAKEQAVAAKEAAREAVEALNLLTKEYTHEAAGVETTGSLRERVAISNIRLSRVESALGAIASDIAELEGKVTSIATPEVQVVVDGAALAEALAQNNNFMDRLISGVTSGLAAEAQVDVRLASVPDAAV